MKADKNDYTPDEKIRFFDTVLNLNILNKGDPDMQKRSKEKKEDKNREES